MVLVRLLLLLLGVSHVAAQTAAPTLNLDQVRTQVADFLQNFHNGTLGTRAPPTACALACAFLDFTLPGTVSYPESSVYHYEESRYWSLQQATAAPYCRMSPLTALDVSLSVLTLRVANCEFAVKSGGHGAFYGASNINGGMTIDLVNMTKVSVDAAGLETQVEPGNRWVDVYKYLQPMSLSVIGGRVSDIGVGGLTLGGGISFFSGRYGWACDNVNNYEVVFADGSINEVNYHTYPDLYFALRGGGNNFGIVTRFDLLTFHQGDLWAGSETFIYSSAAEVALNNAFYWMNINAPSDPYAAVILAYAYVQIEDVFIIASDLEYGKPVANPPILANFTAVPNAIGSTLRVTNLTGLTNEFNNSNPGGYRQTYWALMVRNSASLMTEITAIYMDEVSKVKNATGILPSIVYQPITTAMTSHFSKNGGNALGFSDKDGPLNLINVDISWSLASDDTRILAAARNIVNRANATACAQGLDFRYIYQNYAALEQIVFPSYGDANFAKLRDMSRKYDPSGVFQTLQPGYFKVF